MSISTLELVSEFDTFNLAPSILRGVEAAGFREPRPIQTETIPAALQGRDILGLAATGTGKTAAFALPVLQKLQKRQDGPRILIVAPTRELASQINVEIRMLARFTPIRTVAVYGGVSTRSQITALRRNPDIIVACPGRLLDLYQQKELRLDRIETLVLDEADHMFDMGFLPDIRRIMDALPANRQNLLFSATMPREIRGLADSLLRNPHVVELNHSEPVATVTHKMYPVDNHQKFNLLDHVLTADKPVSTIVFTRTKHRARRLAQQLDRSGYRVIALQGNMSQAQRVRAMEGFRKHQFHVLVATDIAARGIDVEQVSHVVNFDAPDTADAYTHRIGRTGRSERKGQAITFVTSSDQALVRSVEQRIGSSIPVGKVDRITGFELKGEGDGGSNPVFSPNSTRTFQGRRRRRGGRSGYRKAS